MALHLKMDPHWHTYWKVAGDSGLATSIQWTLPKGFTAGEIVWPYPQRIDVSGLISYAFENEVALLVPIDPPPDLKTGTRVVLQAAADWLVCEEICIPGSAVLNVALPVAPEAKPNPASARLFAAARERLPVPASGLEIQGEHNGRQIKVRLKAPPGQALPPDLYFFPKEENQIEYAAAQPVVFPSEGEAELTLTLNALAESPKALSGILVGNPGFGFMEGAPRALEVAIPVRMAAEKAALSPGLLGLAFLGGLILNLMPCVFPVLGLKVLGFVQQGGGDARKIAAHGLAFAAGVLTSFWVLAGVLLALRRGGEELGWGFQLQEPGFVAGMALLLFAFALNLSGVFEFGLSWTRAGQVTAGRQGFGPSFFSGVLATVVATPCSAPFLAPALGAALALEPAASLLMFTCVGLGLAAPYLLFSLRPGLLQGLPKPGAWMEAFKKAMAFPLYATVGFLVWVLAGQVSEGVLLRFLLGLVLLAFAAWLYGSYCLPSSAARVRLWAGLGAAAALWISLLLAWPRESHFPEWERWSPARVAELRAEGRPVYVDFTARWCATCQTNKKVVFGSREVERTFREWKVATLKADWTMRDPEITRELARYGRSAVPFNLLFLPGREDPVILPELLTPGVVLEAFGDLRKAP
jgi:thiol:disulfide interchange protein DsbD